MSKERGKVRWYDDARGFGFIRQDSGNDVFVHYSAILVDRSRIRQGQVVEFEVVRGARGLEATNVRAV